MYKLWRRELSKPTSSDQTTKRKQAEFTQYLSQAIKTIRRKQQFYTRILFLQINPFSHTTYMPPTDLSAKVSISIGIRQHTSYSGLGQSETLIPPETKSASGTQMSQLQASLDIMLSEEEQLLTNIKNYEEEPFYLSKTFLYTMFVRLLQIFEYARQKVLLKTKNQQQVYSRNWQKLYEDNKLALTDCYQNLVYFQNFNVLELLAVSTKKQNHRIYTIIPAKIKKNQVSLKPLMRLSSSELKKAHSIQVKPKKDDMSQIINKKLLVKEKKLFTEKRMQQRKKPKEKPVTMKTLYHILNIKIPKIEEGYAFRREMELDALQRNQSIQEQRKRWQKRCQQRNTSTKTLGFIE